MKKSIFILSSITLSLSLGVLLLVQQAHSHAGTDPNSPSSPHRSSKYTGSKSCRPCHERFYKLWSTSHHGLAMQPYTPEFSKKELLPQKTPIQVGQLQYQAYVGPDQGWVLETGSNGEKKYPIEHAMGGKNVYFFLTPLDKGKLQVLPVSYDVGDKKWYNTTSSMVRHFTDRTDEEIEWTDPLLTFNTSCFGCHVSQLSSNYDVETGTYQTVWHEPGINCEACHGPGSEHIRICEQAEQEGREPAEMKLTVVMQNRGFTAEQVNTSCAPCHAKMSPITSTFKPWDRYFDHYDLVTLEDPDFYPDGRDLGENYTYTLWRMNPCIKKSKLDCMHCHTSSGRYRFHGKEANNACMPCHKKYVRNPTEHTHHEAGTKGNECISCHMPMTEFGRMTRSDHSFRPPMPAATMAFKSPNACNICHTDQTPEWADKHVRKWRTRDYQAPVLKTAHLIDAARKNNWAKLDEMLEYLKRTDRDEIYANSLLRMVRNCPDDRKWPVILDLLKKDSSPLIRASAADILSDNLSENSIPVLAKATTDEYRLVRLRAAASLAPVASNSIPADLRQSVQKATEEYKKSLQVRTDHWTSYYNLGNFHSARMEHQKAAESFERSIRLRPDVLPPYINGSMVYNMLGRNQRAETLLRKALEIEPNNEAVHLNLALLLGELQKFPQAEEHFRKALKINPQSAVAAYNLGVLVANRNPNEAVALTGRAWQLQSDQIKYGYTYAYYLYINGKIPLAIETLQSIITQNTDFGSAYALLGQIYEQQGEFDRAIEVYEKAINNKRLPRQDIEVFQYKLLQLKNQ